ncbi:MAG TPA: radical SAM protein [Stellaceae bacterium]|nr:radical SAM protein [Stellaceae bacterium]
MFYAQPIFRPLSEAQSLLIQATVGCSQPTCTFCPCSTSKYFQIRKPAEVMADMDEAASMMAENVETIFLLAADAFVMRARELCEISRHAYTRFPRLRRISAYATAKDIARKTPEDLRSIREAGLSRLYVGVDSGCDQVLKAIRKQNDAAGTVEGCRKAIAGGFELSVTVILGLGGRELSRDHATATAAAISAIEPNYLGIVTLMVYPETGMGRSVRDGELSVLSTGGLLDELHLMVRGIDVRSRKCVLRTNHPSNYVALLAGTLPDDKEELLKSLASARLENDGEAWRPEMQRSL